jgi:myo-inositol catabolism protein IolC
MDWNKLTLEEKVKWLSQQLEDIRRAQALIGRFERLTQKWLKRVEAIHKKA